MEQQLVWEEVYDLAQLSNMATKSHSFITRWFDDRGYTGGLIIRDLIEVRRESINQSDGLSFIDSVLC